MSRLVTGVSAAPGVGVDGIGSRDAAEVGESPMVGDAVGDGVADTVKDGVEGSVGEGAKDDGGGVGVTGGVEEAVGLPPLQAAIRATMTAVPMVPTIDRPGQAVARPRTGASGAMKVSSFFIRTSPPVIPIEWRSQSMAQKRSRQRAAMTPNLGVHTRSP